jgi:hypothetical protein
VPPRKKPEQPDVPTEPTRPVGRPSSYSDALADAVCERMLNGESLVKICEDEEMPSRTTIYRWMDARPDFVARCNYSRKFGGR